MNKGHRVRYAVDPTGLFGLAGDAIARSRINPKVTKEAREPRRRMHNESQMNELQINELQI